jgi:hypothetical protein
LRARFNVFLKPAGLEGGAEFFRMSSFDISRGQSQRDCGGNIALLVELPEASRTVSRETGVKCKEDSRTPKPGGSLTIRCLAIASWSAAVLCRFSPTVAIATVVLRLAALAGIYSFSAAAAESISTNSNLLNQIPPLAPPKPEISPTFFESHQGLIWVLAGLLVIFCAFIIWLIVRPKPAPIILPAVAAREKLASLRGQPEDGVVLSRTSQILRHYLAAAFQLPAREMTTSEFSACISGDQRIQPELAAKVTAFLCAADERKFNLFPAQETLDAVTTVSQVIDQSEARLTELSLASDAKVSRPDSTQTVQTR